MYTFIEHVCTLIGHALGMRGKPFFSVYLAPFLSVYLAPFLSVYLAPARHQHRPHFQACIYPCHPCLQDQPASAPLNKPRPRLACTPVSDWPQKAKVHAPIWVATTGKCACPYLGGHNTQKCTPLSGWPQQAKCTPLSGWPHQARAGGTGIPCAGGV